MRPNSHYAFLTILIICILYFRSNFVPQIEHQKILYMTAKKKSWKESSILFDERVGVCYIAMCLDKRNPARVVKEEYPICMRFTIQRARYYHNLGEKCTPKEMARIAVATGQGERKTNEETFYERQTRLQEVFTSFIKMVVNVNETGPLTLDRIKTALTGRCESTSFIGLWEEIIAEKRKAGKAGTGDAYRSALRSFKELTGFTRADGFAVDTGLVNRWVGAMTEHKIAPSTQGIYLRTCRLVVNRCIGEGFLMPKAYMFGKSKDKVKIPVGASRKGWYLTVEQMKELYDHLMEKDLNLPIFDQRIKDNPSYAVKTEAARELVYQALAMFLMQYFCCGCNLVDLSLLTYNRFYFDSNRQAFRFIRRKSEDETNSGEGMEVIVPVIEPIKKILELYSPNPTLDSMVFPFLMGDAQKKGSQAVRDRVHQENKNISDRMKKVAESLGWSVCPTGTYARHSFATNLHAAKVPMEYISDAMGHSLGNRGQITMRYISPYTIEERKKYNNLLMGINEEVKQVPIATGLSKQALFAKMDAFSEDDIKEALMMLKRKEMERFEKELYG